MFSMIRLPVAKTASIVNGGRPNNTYVHNNYKNNNLTRFSLS
jgi:hypothetical protein